jgi:hypothetical protein
MGSVQEACNIPAMEYYTIFRVPEYSGLAIRFSSQAYGLVPLFPWVASAAGGFKWIRGTPDAIRRTLLFSSERMHKLGLV